MNTRIAVTTVATVVAIAATALIPQLAVANESPSNDTLRAVADARAATARFQHPEAAVAAGYLPTDECVDLPGVGGMGYHYIKPQLVTDGVNYAEPEVLIYADQPNGRRKLVALEYIVLDADQDPSTVDMPAWADEPFNAVKGDGVTLPYHYPLHVWLWEHNPAGMFEDWNPRIGC